MPGISGRRSYDTGRRHFQDWKTPFSGLEATGAFRKQVSVSRNLEAPSFVVAFWRRWPCTLYPHELNVSLPDTIFLAPISMREGDCSDRLECFWWANR